MMPQSSSLIDAAKKEGGRVVLYTSMETFTADALKAAFEKSPIADMTRSAPA